MADCHLGAWAEQPKLKELGVLAFEKAISICINRNVAFILISGDLFNTAIPSIEVIKSTASILKKAKDHNIDIYTIPGSHDFSPSGKTMLDVLEEAGLLKNVESRDSFTTDKTGTKLVGILGLRGGLEKEQYRNLHPIIHSEKGFKIFLFHTALEELKPKDLEKVNCMSTAELPGNFAYYAGGHVHYILETRHKDGKLVYPGPLFPNNFKELEELKHGGFYIVDVEQEAFHSQGTGSSFLRAEYVPLSLKEVLSVEINSNNKTPQQLEREIGSIRNFNDKILLLRFNGILSSGTPSDLNFREISKNFSSAYALLKNTTKLFAKESPELSSSASSMEEMEEDAIKKSITGSGIFENEEEMIHKLLLALNKEKKEGEKNADFEARVLSDIKISLGKGWVE
jgi:DNA repair exonuclease SbcCD nuclease subunit